MQSGLLADAASLGETDSVDRYLYTVWTRGPSNSKLIASCGAVSCADGAEGLHFSAILFIM